MLTRCPYSSCPTIFDTEDAGDRVALICPNCGHSFSFRSLEHWLAVDKRINDARQPISGGPDLNGALPMLSALVEDVRSLWNVGSIFRSADGAGVAALYLCGITGSPPRKEIAKTSLGAEESVSWRYFRSAVDVLPSLRQRGVTIIGLERRHCELFGSKPLVEELQSHDIKLPVCLVVGNEVRGLSVESLSNCDLIAELPMRGIKESLNVAVAFGIAAYMLADHAMLNH